MECYICSREHDAQRLPFLCSVDARNRLYEGRMSNLQLVLESEDLKAQISGVTDATTPDNAEAASAQQQQVAIDTDLILAAADKLRADIKAAKDEIQFRQAALSKRRSDLTSISSGLSERRSRQQQEVEKSAQTLTVGWAKSAEDMAGTRAFLCKEAVRLYGLKRTRKGSGGRYEYQLGKLPIVDISNMDCELQPPLSLGARANHSTALSPEVISTSLAHMAHIVVLVAHYLAIRLPAEITLPHRDYPRPTIFNLATSYQHNDAPFPTSLSSSTGLSEPRSSDFHQAPRPRPLFIDKPLSRLAREDPSAHSFFLEGVTLLAYDVAWLCCSQGTFSGDKGSLEDICNMGKNMYNLLISPPLHGPTNMPPQSAGTGNEDSKPESWIGRYSHGTMYYSLGGADGTELIKSFKLPSPMKLADKLKKKVIGDAPVTDWEVLDTDAWKVDDGPTAATPGPKETVNSPPHNDSKGWMKVKSR